MIQSCITILSSMLITNKHVYLQVQVSEECYDVQYVEMHLNNQSYIFILTEQTVQEIVLNITIKEPSQVKFALLKIVNLARKEQYIITNIQYQSIIIQNCIQFSSFNLSSRRGQSSLYFTNYSCPTKLLFEQIYIVFTLNDGSKLIDHKQKYKMQIFDENLDEKQFSNALHYSCNQNLSCYQLLKNQLSLEQNFVDLHIKFEVGMQKQSPYFIEVFYKQIYINGLFEVCVVTEQYSIDDYFFIADFQFSNYVGSINNFNVTITMDNITLFLKYDPQQNYYILNCKKIYKIGLYNNCMNNLLIYKQKFHNDINANFFVNIFLKDEKNRLISRYSSSQKIDQILTQIIKSFYYHNGVFYVHLIKNVGYQINAKLILPDKTIEHIILQNYENNNYNCKFHVVRSLKQKQEVQMIIEIVEKDQKVQKYAAQYTIKRLIPYALHIYFPVTVFMTLFSCLFLHPITYADLQQNFE